MTVSPTASEARRREQLQRRAVSPTPCCVALALPASADAVELAVDRSGAGRPPGGGVAGGGGGGGEQCQQAREQQHCARRRGAKLSRVPPALGAATAWASGRRLRACRLRIVCGPQAARRRSPPLHDGRWLDPGPWLLLDRRSTRVLLIVFESIIYSNIRNRIYTCNTQVPYHGKFISG